MGVSPNAPFTGILPGTLDRKGRVCIPATYRHILQAQNTNGVYMRQGLLSPSLECFGALVMQTFQDAQITNDPYFTAARRTAAFALFSLSQELAVDDTGRVRLPEEFIVYAGIAENVTFFGIGRSFEIWDAASFARVREEQTAAAREEARAQMATKQ